MVNEYLFKKILGELANYLPLNEGGKIIHHPFGVRECFTRFVSKDSSFEISCEEDQSYLVGFINEKKLSWFFYNSYKPIGSWSYSKKIKLLKISLRGQIYINTIDK